MTVLSVIRQFCARTNISVPTSVHGTTDEQVLQLKGLLDEEGVDLAKRGGWEALIVEAVHVTLAAEDQGRMTDIAPNGFRNIILDSFWDRTMRLEVGVVSGREWQRVKGFSTTGPRFRVRVRGGRLIVNPIPPAGNTWAFEYVSKNWLLDPNGTLYKEASTHDNDELLLPEALFLMGLRWRWKKEKGFDYAEDFATYERQVSQALGADGMKETLTMSEPSVNAGVFVPQGNWNLP